MLYAGDRPHQRNQLHSHIAGGAGKRSRPRWNGEWEWKLALRYHMTDLIKDKKNGANYTVNSRWSRPRWSWFEQKPSKPFVVHDPIM